MKKVIYLFLLLMSYSCCHIPMMVINNKTNDDIQFLFDSKDSTVYVYPVMGRYVNFYWFYEKEDYVLEKPQINLCRDTIYVQCSEFIPPKMKQKPLTEDNHTQAKQSPSYNPEEIENVFLYNMPPDYRLLVKNKRWIQEYVDNNLNSLTLIYGNERIYIKDPEKIKRFLMKQWGKNPNIGWFNDSKIKITERRLNKWKKEYQ